MFKKSKGFTLIELIVVMAILAILVTLAAPKFLGQTEKANFTKLTNDAKVLEDAAMMYNIDNPGTWPTAGVEIDPVTLPDVYGIDNKGFTNSTVLTGNEEFYAINLSALNPYIKSINSDINDFVLDETSGSVYVLDPNFSATPLTIGQSYQGGIIAYILQSSDLGYVEGETHGLIAATADQSTGIAWAVTAYETTSVPGTLTTIGSGAANTDKIIAQNGAGSTYAAGLCDAYTNNDTGTGIYSDWYLPSSGELNQLYLNKDAVGGFASVYYWSSSEYRYDLVLVVRFTDGFWPSDYKYSADHVRAVRSF